MDAPTADNEVVLASMGGMPKMPESKDEDEETDESPGTSHGADVKEAEGK